MILPGSSLGVLGGGQLGRMFVAAARTMGYRTVVLDPDAQSPAGAVADLHLTASYEDERALDRLAAECAAITTEFENQPASALEFLARRRPVHPGASAVAIAQDRIAEKSFLTSQGFPTARFRPVRTLIEAEAAFAEIGAPSLLKTSRLGYDGKGQATISSLEEVRAAFGRFKRQPCVLEERVDLELEVSVVLARGADGQVAGFPVGENRHEKGILDTTVVPARASERLQREAARIATEVAARLAYIGVLGIEMFVSKGGGLLLNELAPRPHNSGHYTLDACVTNQFEQQVRTLCGLPLGDPTLRAPAAMANLLGDLWSGGEPRWAAALADPGVKLHLYGKREPRPGRKMGHLTCVAPSAAEALRRVRRAREKLLGR